MMRLDRDKSGALSKGPGFSVMPKDLSKAQFEANFGRFEAVFDFSFGQINVAAKFKSPFFSNLIPKSVVQAEISPKTGIYGLGRTKNIYPQNLNLRLH